MKNRLLNVLVEYDSDLKEIVDEGDCCWNQDGPSYLRYSYVKWYDTYPSVNKIMHFLEQILDCDDFQMVRTGEEMDDNYIDGGYYDAEIYINRSIEIG